MGLHEIFFNIYKAIDSIRNSTLQNQDLERVDSNTAVTLSIYQGCKRKRTIEKKAEEEKEANKKEKELMEQRKKEVEEMSEQKLFEEWTWGHISWKELEAAKIEKSRM